MKEMFDTNQAQIHHTEFTEIWRYIKNKKKNNWKGNSKMCYHYPN